MGNEVERQRLLIDGQWVDSGTTYPVQDKYSNATIAEVAQARPSDVEAAVAAAQRAFDTSPLSPYRRYQILSGTAQLMQQRAETMAAVMARETGSTLPECRVEVERGIQDFILSAEEAKRIGGEVLPLAANPGSENRFGFTMRVPVGVVCAITPFNAPLSLAAHKVAPALACGCTVVLKPAPQAPLTALATAKMLQEAGLPAGHLNVVTGSGAEVGEWLLDDPRIRFYSFTGSAAVGERI